jgi:hypothetical protein
MPAVTADCPPMANFIAYWSETPTATYATQDTTLCLADAYVACLDDINCMAFDTLRRFWAVRPTGLTSMAGMCTYVRADGF